uniref:Uncharacterized protein n=1 Tax=Anguilla anguilla TaxID=7936 RepID=A0A0E9XR58_ANGAN
MTQVIDPSHTRAAKEHKCPHLGPINFRVHFIFCNLLTHSFKMHIYSP